MTTSVSFKWKYWILGLLFLGWSVGNMDRFAINYAVLGITEDMGLSASSTGIILSSFFAGYALMQIPGGYLADRFGYRRVIITSIVMWSLFTIATGLAWSLTSLILIRFLFGLSEGSFFPSASKAITGWFPTNERSRAMSIMLTSGSVMGVVTPIVTTQAMAANGWRPVFYWIGAIGLLFAVLFLFFLKEKEKADKKKPSETANLPAGTAQSAPLASVLKSPLVWKLFVGYFSIYVVSWGLNSWMPTYMRDVRGLDLASIGYLSAIPAFVGIFAMLISGVVLDKLPRGRDLQAAAGSAVVVAILLYLMQAAGSAAMFVGIQCLVMVFQSFVVILIASSALKHLPESNAASANGFINTGAQIAGFLAPTMIGFMIDASGGSYMSAFILMMVFACVSAASLLLISRRSKLGNFTMKEGILHE
ncbi:MFS transporter [Cohnella hashimotonis]|uniref:MFS transporter n=1 Tax=Cohnella hashimotonis TaxID=2826895 RepID=A0ABT6TAC2_9BACL|nr:MFS transporter [Cohnella hashimotonis]MDI4643501.1 MFS transporter [Cohnella hashimotonis]